MKERPILMAGQMVRAVLAGRKTVTRRLVGARDIGSGIVDGAAMTSSVAFGTAGDRLYVRESYAPRDFDGGKHAYAADWVWSKAAEIAIEPKWTPSIHMPRSAARIFLDVTSVRVERLGDITDEDVFAEGIQCFDGSCGEVRFGARDLSDRDRRRDWNHLPRSPIAAFVSLWDSLAPKGSAWSDNPWVWRVSFSRAVLP